MEPTILLLFLVIIILLFGLIQSVQQNRLPPEDLKSQLNESNNQDGQTQTIVKLVTPYSRYPWYRSMFWDRYYDWYNTPDLYYYYNNNNPNYFNYPNYYNFNYPYPSRQITKNRNRKWKKNFKYR